MKCFFLAQISDGKSPAFEFLRFNKVHFVCQHTQKWLLETVAIKLRNLSESVCTFKPELHVTDILLYRSCDVVHHEYYLRFRKEVFLYIFTSYFFHPILSREGQFNRNLILSCYLEFHTGSATIALIVICLESLVPTEKKRVELNLN